MTCVVDAAVFEEAVDKRRDCREPTGGTIRKTGLVAQQCIGPRLKPSFCEEQVEPFYEAARRDSRVNRRGLFVESPLLAYCLRAAML